MDDEFEIDPEIAAAMGFASFGAQPSSKKRKFNRDDAIVEGQDADAGREVFPAGSGANNVALGVRASASAGARESGGVDGAAGSAAGEGAEGGDVEVSVEERDKGKAKGEKKTKRGAPRGLADYIAWGNAVVAQPGVAEKAETEAEAELVESVAGAADAAHIPAQKTIALRDTASHTQTDWAASRRGVVNSRGDPVYFKPSFIEDPWKGLVG